MDLKLSNTLSGKLEIFEPENNKKVKMYVCGPTVYDKPHIGNGRALVVYDILFRLLKALFGPESVIYIRNITDVDDKIINRANELKITTDELCKKTIKEFFEDCEYLICDNPTIQPKATEHIKEMIFIIEKLISKGHAYISNNHVYFSVSSYKDYTLLSKRDMNSIISGSRIEIDPNKKEAEDFILWKPAKKEENCSFESPWGLGRPGWHIECSAMSYKYLGENFDIHGGGADLMFPHHTNEIAQSCCAFESSSFAKTWVHNGFLTVNNEKMSKSLDNFITIYDIRNSGEDGEILRIALATTHYKSPLDYSKKLFEDTKSNLNYLYRSLEPYNTLEEISFINLPPDFTSPILNDLNIQLAFTYMIELAKQLNKAPDSFKANILFSCGRFLGIFNKTTSSWFGRNNNSEIIESLITKRKEAKNNKDWDLSDKIRSELNEMGIILEDKPDGSTIWRRK